MNKLHRKHHHVKAPLLLALTALLLAVATTSSQPIMQSLLKDYDTNVRPSDPGIYNKAVCSSVGPGTEPDVVKVQIGLEGVNSIDQTKMSYKMDGYLRVWWQDKRLAFGNYTCRDQLTLGPPQFDPAKLLWVPPISIQGSQKYEMLGGANGGEMLRLDRDGSIYWSRALGVELRCDMNFGRLPYDSQYCLVGIWLYRYKSADVHLEWKDAALEGAIKVINPDHLHSTDWTASVFKARNYQKHYTSGALSFAQVCLKFERSSFSCMYTIMTAIMLVIANYSGLFISAAAVPGRVALAFLSFLMVLNSMNHTLGMLPPPPIDRRIWLCDFLLGHLFLNFSLLIEFACLNFGTRYVTKENAKIKKSEAEDCMIDRTPPKIETNVEMIQIGGIGALGDYTPTPAPTMEITPDAKETFSCYAVTMARIGHHMIKLDQLTRRYFLVVYITFLVVMFSTNDQYTANEGCW